MIDKKLNDIRSNLKRAFPSITREIDNLIGNLIEDLMDSNSSSSPLDDLKQDLEYTLQAHNISFTKHQIDGLLK